MNLTNNTNIHMSFAIWLVSDSYDYDNRPNAISATKLLDSTRQIVLNSRASKLEQTEGVDLANFIPSSLGNAIHDSTEHAWKYDYAKACKKLGYSDKLIKRILINPDPKDLKPNTIPIYLEQRAEKEIDGYFVTGKYDAIMDGQIIDYKSTGTYTYMNIATNNEKYILQESIYRWLNQDKVTNDIGLINFVFTDWSKLQSMIQGKKGYPPSRLVTHPIQLLSIKDTEAFIRNKIAQVTKYIHSDECDLPLCTKEELWSGKTVFKYFKNPSGKRATKNYDNYAEAQTHLIKDGSVGKVIEVKGKVRRCEYCNGVAVGCSQSKELILAGLLDIT
jgi:hypothetical protein